MDKPFYSCVNVTIHDYANENTTIDALYRDDTDPVGYVIHVGTVTMFMTPHRAKRLRDALSSAIKKQTQAELSEELGAALV